MKLVDQWRAIQEGLPEDWSEVRLTLTTEQLSDLPRAAQVLGAINAGRVGQALAFEVQRSGANSAQKAAHLFQRLDDERTWCQIETSNVAVADAPSGHARRARCGPSPRRGTRRLRELPPDWSDLLCEIEIYSSALLDRTALLCAPVNPTRPARGRRSRSAARRASATASRRRWRDAASSDSTRTGSRA